MKTRSIILLILLTVSLSCRAETCPPVNTIDINNPPAGWQVLLPPPLEDEYHFGKAIHSFNGNFFYKQVICIYESCPSFGCPTFELLSTKTYELPNTITKNWNQPAIIADTIMCAPADNNPLACEFE